MGTAVNRINKKGNKTPQDELKIVKERINKRIETFQAELTQEIEEEPAEEAAIETNAKEPVEEKKPEEKENNQPKIAENNIKNTQTKKLIENKPI